MAESTPTADQEIEVDTDFWRPRAVELDNEIDITPMIDIVFLLLIFFLVSSQMTGEATVDLPAARHGGVVAAKESVIILMRRGTGEQAEVLQLDGTQFSADLEQQQSEIAEYVAGGLDSGKKHVIIRAEGSVRHGEIGRVSRAIAESLPEGEMIHIAVIEQG
ncbi:MAG: biopolymer transporter ExbD [Pirellulaceae bacterium]|nr:biopolymer transporter ExbD [Pirellulaceae bacterium]